MPFLLTALAFSAAGLVAAAAWRLRWLTASGAVAAAAVGGAILGFGGWWAAAALAAFFFSGTALTRVGGHRKAQPEHLRGGRDAGQVLGTAGVAAVAATLWGLGVLPDPTRGLLVPALLGALATAAADTWATEVGMLSRVPPRLITTWAYVPAGTSGGLTLVGTLAGVAGAVLVAAAGAGRDPRLFTAAWIAGVLGMIVDSLLGATLQAAFRRPDGVVTETPGSGVATVRGLRWMTNSTVNAVATLLGAAAAAALSRVL
ncbi:MAG: DUF92 domain-containing protein [Armatimonadota bacterium]|nr:DUF92 domain-containing protein [Armatimonadota bacterium]MDR7533600.1 DUF92 domain-containing protein [Armatimonadota bacterium]MDR7537399.1 DUF92 domain-containing protein [Armatimonadota bacterium]